MTGKMLFVYIELFIAPILFVPRFIAENVKIDPNCVIK